MKKYIFLLVITSFFLSCGEYQKLLKSDDRELQYAKAVEYFEKGDFSRAQTLFDYVAMHYRASERSELILNYLAKSYIGMKDYFMAMESYRTYIRNYPKGLFSEEAKFMIGYCHYKESPDIRLDQTSTYAAISAFQEFIDVYPASERVPEAHKLLDELNDKLAEKSYLNAKLYYNLGNFRGNNYESAIIEAQNALKKYPSTVLREDFSFLILESKYQQAYQSVEELKIERYRDAVDEYYSYITEYPEGKYKRQAEKMFQESKKVISD